MAITQAGSRLTEAHRLAQLSVSREAVRNVLRVWPLLDPRALDATFPRYAEVMTAVLAQHKQRSAAVAAQYLRSFREAEGVPGTVDIRLLDALARRQALTSLLVTGPIATKVGIRGGKPLEVAYQEALEMTLGAAIRLVLQGGRDTVLETVKADKEALGWARITDGDPCYFCAMLAGRGAVYKKETVDFKPHDKCGCTAEPVYSEEYKMPERSQQWSDLWGEVTGGLSGQDAINAFRRAYEAKRKTALITDA